MLSTTDKELPPLVESTKKIKQIQGETFITQRGGKILQTKSKVDDKLSQATILLQKQKELELAQMELDKKRLEVVKRMEECRDRREALKAKQKQLKDRVSKFQKFLMESNEKRVRAINKAQMERKMRDQKTLELGMLVQELKGEESINQSTVKKVVEHKKYENYLTSVLHALPPNYLDMSEPQISDMLMRYQTLKETHLDLLHSIDENQVRIEKAQEQLTSILKAKSDALLVYNSSLGAMQKKLERIRQECAVMNQRLDEKAASGMEKMRLVGETKLAIQSLFERVSFVSGSKDGPSRTEEPLNLEDRLSVVQNKILDTISLVSKAEKIQGTKQKKKRANE